MKLKINIISKSCDGELEYYKFIRACGWPVSAPRRKIDSLPWGGNQGRAESGRATGAREPENLKS